MDGEKELTGIDSHLDLTRTNELFDASIAKSGARSKTGQYDDKSLREAKIVIGMGNMHLNTAKTKVGIQRLLGFKNNIKKLKQLKG